MKNANLKIGLTVALTLIIALAFPRSSRAHCDSLDGPVVLDARTALEKKDITPLLKWVKPADEALIREAFNRTIAVRQMSPEAKVLADAYFFETVVRIHRAGEGASYTGLKPAGTMPPVILEADRALDAGSIDKLAKTMGEHTSQGLRERFERAVNARAHAKESVQAGREYVEAYSTYIHYVEGIANVVHGTAHEEGAEGHR